MRIAANVRRIAVRARSLEIALRRGSGTQNATTTAAAGHMGRTNYDVGAWKGMGIR